MAYFEAKRAKKSRGAPPRTPSAVRLRHFCQVLHLSLRPSFCSTGAYRDRSPLYLTQRLSLSCRPSGRTAMCSVPDRNVRLRHREPSSFDRRETPGREHDRRGKASSPGAPARHGIVRDVANAARSLHACRARIVGAHLRRAIVPTHRSMPPWHRGSEATVGAEGRRSRRRCKLSVRIAKKRASCAAVHASLSKGFKFGT